MVQSKGLLIELKVLKRNAYGYRKDTHFKNHILLVSQLSVSRRKKETKLSLLGLLSMSSSLLGESFMTHSSDSYFRYRVESLQ